MKKRKPVKPRRAPKSKKKISRLQASEDRHRHPVAPMPEWPGYYRPIKKPITLRIDADVVAWFQRQGHGYQTRINRALRKVMMDERKRSEE